MTLEKCTCNKLDSEYLGKSIDVIENLSESLNEIKIDSKEWISIFECRICGQAWKEYYVFKGHSSIPNVVKIHNVL